MKLEEYEITEEVDNNSLHLKESALVSETEEIEEKLANLETEEEKDEAWKEFLMKDAIEANDGKLNLSNNDENYPKDQNECASGEMSINEMQEASIESTSSKPTCKNVYKLTTDAPQRNDPTENDKQRTSAPTDAALEQETDNLPITSLIERMDTDSRDDNTGMKQKQTVKKQNAHKVDLKKVDQ